MTIQSKRAKEYLKKNWSTCENLLTFKIGFYVPRARAKQSIEIAEQDARERAVKAFKMACEWYDDGRDSCWRSPTDPQRKCSQLHCADFQNFIKHYDNE